MFGRSDPPTYQKEVRTLTEQLHDLRPKLGDMPQEIREQIRALLLDIWQIIDLNDDARNKREVYAQIARFLQERFDRPAPVCLAATHLLCNEKDEAILRALPDAGASPPVDSGSVRALEAEAKARVLAIKVHYLEKVRFHTYGRKVEIFFSEGQADSVAKTTFEQEMSWNGLPSEVRESILNGGLAAFSFNLYKREG